MTAVKVSVEGAKASDKNPLFLSNETFKPYRPAAPIVGSPNRVRHSRAHSSASAVRGNATAPKQQRFDVSGGAEWAQIGLPLPPPSTGICG